MLGHCVSPVPLSDSFVHVTVNYQKHTRPAWCSAFALQNNSTVASAHGRRFLGRPSAREGLSSAGPPPGGYRTPTEPALLSACKSLALSFFLGLPAMLGGLLPELVECN